MHPFRSCSLFTLPVGAFCSFISFVLTVANGEREASLRLMSTGDCRYRDAPMSRDSLEASSPLVEPSEAQVSPAEMAQVAE